MKSKSVAYLLIIASLLCVLLNVNGFIYTMVQSKSPVFLEMMLDLLLSSVSPVGFAWIGFSLLRKKKLPGKKVGIAFAILSGLILGVRFYYIISYFSLVVFLDNALDFTFNYLTTLFPVSVFIFWLMFLAGKFRKGAVWLLAGAIFSFVYSFTNKFFFIALYFSSRNIFGNNYWDKITNVSRMIDILYPLALGLFAFFILEGYVRKKAVGSVQVHDHEDLLDGMTDSAAVPVEAALKEEKIPSVLDWLSDFLLVMIPLFGVGFLIWRGQNNKDKYRRNWAIATLFWTALGFASFCFLYANIWLRSGITGGVIAILVLVILTLFSVAVGLSGKARRDDEDADADDGEEYVPSVSAWFGRIFAISIPLVGLIVLITSAVEEEDQVRKKWAIANLIRMAVTIVYYLCLYITYSNILKYTSIFGFSRF